MINYISLEFTLKTHDQLIDEYGGKKGILNLGLLQSALEMPKATFGGRDLHRTIFDKTAAYLFHIIKNHPFVDGNKRTAAMIGLVFLTSNNGTFTIFNDEYEDLILRVAQGTVLKKKIAKFFRDAKKQNSEYLKNRNQSQ